MKNGEVQLSLFFFADDLEGPHDSSVSYHRLQTNQQPSFMQEWHSVQCICVAFSIAMSVIISTGQRMLEFCCIEH